MQRCRANEGVHNVISQWLGGLLLPEGLSGKSSPLPLRGDVFLKGFDSRSSCILLKRTIKSVVCQLPFSASTSCE